MGQAKVVQGYNNRFLHFSIIHGCFNNIILAFHDLSFPAALTRFSNAIITFEIQTLPHRLHPQVFENTGKMLYLECQFSPNHAVYIYSTMPILLHSLVCLTHNHVMACRWPNSLSAPQTGFI
jgi:hypothetical protein